MIKIVTTSFLLITFYYSNCQSETNYYFDYDEYLLERYDKLIKTQKGVKSIETEFVKSEGKKPKICKTYYNSEGYLIKAEKMVNGKYVLISETKYNDHNKVTERIIYKKGKIHKRTTKSYDSKDNLLSLQIIKGKNKLKVKNEWTYGDKNRTVSSVRYKKDGKSIYRQWKYEYYDNGRRSRTILMNKEGKILHEWTYDCDQEGELHKAEKKKSKFCVWNKANEDTLIYSMQELDRKRGIRKYVTGYTIKDTLPLFHKVYNEKNRLLFHDVYDRSFQRITQHRFYNKKGIMTFIAYTKYSGDNVVEELALDEGKQLYKRTYSYFEDGLLSERIEYFRKRVSVTTLHYSK